MSLPFFANKSFTKIDTCSGVLSWRRTQQLVLSFSGRFLLPASLRPWQRNASNLTYKTRKINWLIGKHSPLSLENKLIIYKTVLKPVRTYGIELWGRATAGTVIMLSPDVGKRPSQLQMSNDSPIAIQALDKTASNLKYKRLCRTMGMCFSVQHSCHPAIAIQTSQIYNQCPTVCLQSHPPFRPTHPVHPHGFPGTDSNPSHGPGLAPTPSHGTTSAPAKQKALEKKMDVWRDTPRKASLDAS